MADFCMLLVYFGGATSFQGRGFWKTVFWPYHLGKRIGRYASQRPHDRKERA